MIAASEKVIVLRTKNNINKVKRHSVAPIRKIDTIVTDIETNDPIFEDFKEKGIKIL